MALEQYQDIRMRGQVEIPGVRECARRYAAIRSVCARFERPFTVLDIGANMGYFSVRLAEDFDCTVVAVEHGYANWLATVLSRNDNRRVIAIKKLVTADNLVELGQVEHFDVVLAMSMVHHVPGPYSELVDALRMLGEHLIVELPNEAGACNPGQVAAVYPPDEAVQIGTGASHLGGEGRGIWHAYTPKPEIQKSYIGVPDNPGQGPAAVDSTWSHKLIRFPSKDVPAREFHRGINFWTWLRWGQPLWPNKNRVFRMVTEAADKVTDAGQHGDLMPWNVIFHGDGVVWIDDEHDARANIDDSWALQALRRLDTVETGAPL